MSLRLLIACAAALFALAGPAAGQAWPSKPIHVIVPFGAGSAADVIPRIVLEQVSAQIGQPIVIENRPGAGSTTGSAVVAKAEPDGYTLLSTSSAFSITPAIYPNLPYDPTKDLVGVAPFGGLPSVMIVASAAPYNTLAEFVTTAKANPNAFNFASVGIGSAVHMAAERFRLSAGYQAAHVPFKSGSEALTEVIAERIQYYFCPANTALPFIRDGKLKALAVSTPKRIAALPDVPTTLEAGFAESDYSSWVGVMVPAQTPKDIVARLHKEIAEALQTAKVRDKLVPNGIEPLALTPEQFNAQIAEEIKVNAVLAKALSLKGN
jgi:tripartite-type tricarboxylate transporter receptor subunit TctC